LILTIGLISAVLVWRIVDMIKKTLRGHIEMEHELRETEHRVQQMQRVEALGQLVGGVAHDFNNLLTAIQGNTELLLNSLPEEHQFEAKEIEKSAERAASLTRRLLAFARRQPMDFQSVDLNQLVQGMEQMLRRLIGEQIELVALCSDDAAVVHTDPAQLEQVIMNLVINARDAMPDGGKLTITVAEAGGERWAVTVADTGIGMDSDVQEKMFEPFFTTKGRRRGTGLGLSSAHGIVKKSGGEFRVRSEPGKGTEITILLPAEGSRQPEDDVTPRSQPARGDETILLVEDEQQIRRLTAGALGRLGYKVISAADGHEALRISGEYPERIHLILSDVIMPGLNGRELVDAILRHRPSMRVIFMSGYTEDVVLQSGVTGIDYPLVQKPFVIADLAVLIRETLAQPLSVANA
ncbi:MAG: response regulator, partial [Gammaproteobacteria bacterium]|nr:response regulator [Gammaproteobacteria bacterium]